VLCQRKEELLLKWAVQLLYIIYFKEVSELLCYLLFIHEGSFNLYRYLIDTKWFKQWKKFVGFDSWDTRVIGEDNAFPGPIDNAPLFKGK
jgi:hypothetical protein